jgi:hypothetical protein
VRELDQTNHAHDSNQDETKQMHKNSREEVDKGTRKTLTALIPVVLVADQFFITPICGRTSPTDLRVALRPYPVSSRTI